MANSLEAVAPGFRFDPTDEQLVGYFLYKLLVENEPLPPLYNSVIHVRNVFGDDSEPSEIWTKYGGGPDQLFGHQELYFISEIKRLTPKRIDRKSGHGGTWTEKEVSKRVMNGNRNPIGLKRKFRYVNEASEDDGRWLLDEYSLFSGPKKLNDKSYDFDFVICRMRTNDRCTSRVHKRSMSSSQDALLEEKTKNKKMKIDQRESIGSSLSMSAMINSTDEEVPVPEGCSSALVIPDNIDYDDPTILDDNTAFTLEELFPETHEVSLPAASGPGVIDEGAEGGCNTSFDIEELSSETYQVALPTASGNGGADGGAVQALNPNKF